jgi:hypothetical protein
MTLGDNPSVSTGVPVTIEWDVQAKRKFSFEQFEKVRPERRDLGSLRMSVDKRVTIVTN